jgi:hypothetical protein
VVGSSAICKESITISLVRLGGAKRVRAAIDALGARAEVFAVWEHEWKRN